MSGIKRHTNKEDFNLSPELAEVISSLPEPKKKIILQAFVQQSVHHGPLPDANTISVYNSVIPNGGDRLM